MPDPIILSRYHVDAYCRPRVLASAEVVLHAVAWPIVMGVSIGFMLAISLLVLHHPSLLEPLETISWRQFESSEESP